MTDSLNLGRGYSDYMPPSVATEALKQVVYSSDPLMHQETRSYVRVTLTLSALI